MAAIRGMLVAALAVAAPATARAQAQVQVEVRFNAAAQSAYVDRGVILSNAPVAQPSLAVAGVLGGGLLGLDLGATFELLGPADSSSASMAPPSATFPRLTELRPALFLSQPFDSGAFRVDARFEYRRFTSDSNFSTSVSWGTAVGRLSFPRSVVRPRIGLGYDVGGVEGAWAEVGLAPRFAVTRGIDLVLDAEAGWAFNQRADSGAPQLAFYEWDGFTHLEVGVALDLLLAGLTVSPSLDLAWLRPPLLDPLAPQGARASREWFARAGVAIGIGGRFPKPPPPPPPKKKR